MKVAEYRGYEIYYQPPPIPIRSCDYQFCHVDVDVAPDSTDTRYGTGPTLDSCIEQIREKEDY